MSRGRGERGGEESDIERRGVLKGCSHDGVEWGRLQEVYLLGFGITVGCSIPGMWKR